MALELFLLLLLQLLGLFFLNDVFFGGELLLQLGVEMLEVAV